MANTLRTTLREYNKQFTTTVPSQLVRAKEGEHGDFTEWYILPNGDIGVRIIKKKNE